MPRRSRSRARNQTIALILLAPLLAAATACGQGRKDAGFSRAGGDARAGAAQMRLGYFPNLTHAPALAAIELGMLRQTGKAAGRVSLHSFSAGPAAVEALFSSAVDLTYMGPGPAINAFVRSRGEAIRIISGAAEGGASLVVDGSIRRPEDLAGKNVATPQLGNTQDIALRFWLKSHGLDANLQGGGEVSVIPQENAQTYETFRAGTLAAAWVPEPWASRLVVEAGGKTLVDERTLWPEGRFPTTVLVGRTEYLRQNAGAVQALLRTHIAATDFLNTDPGARDVVNRRLAEDAGKPLSAAVLNAAWPTLRFTTDLVPSSFSKLARRAKILGLLPGTDLRGAFEPALLKKALEGSL